MNYEKGRNSTENRPPQGGNLILCGFMGCGKTSVGRRVAKLMGRRFCDLDQWIEQQAGMTVSQIFDVPVAALQERLKRDKRRPLLQVPNRRQVIAELYEKRVPLYQAAADVTIDAGAPPLVVAKRIAQRFS